jgi:hypothetical protein
MLLVQLVCRLSTAGGASRQRKIDIRVLPGKGRIDCNDLTHGGVSSSTLSVFTCLTRLALYHVLHLKRTPRCSRAVSVVLSCHDGGNNLGSWNTDGWVARPHCALRCRMPAGSPCPQSQVCRVYHTIANLPCKTKPCSRRLGMQLCQVGHASVSPENCPWSGS